MRLMGSASRVALVFDDELQRQRFAEHIGSATRIYQARNGQELLRLAAANVLDVAVVGVLHKDDQFLASAVAELQRSWPRVGVVGVFDVSRPSIDEAADLARELPEMGFVRRPGPRLDYLALRRTPGSPAPSFTHHLLACMDRLPLFGPARAFAIMQALHPSYASTVPEDAGELGLSRRNLERWFQGPDLCSPNCFQSVAGAAEAAYLRLICRVPEGDIASIVGLLTRDGVENPLAVGRAVRTTLRSGMEELRLGGMPALVQAVEAALRASRNPVRTPAQWGLDTCYRPQPGVLIVPVEKSTVLMDPSRGVEYLLDAFGLDAWPLVVRGTAFGQMVAQLAFERRERPTVTRSRLIAWLGELLMLQLIRRERGSAQTADGA